MPYQVNGQLVEMKSKRLPHAVGAAGSFVTTGGGTLVAAAAGAPAAMMSPADESAAYAAPASTSNIPAGTPEDTANIFILALFVRVIPRTRSKADRVSS